MERADHSNYHGCLLLRAQYGQRHEKFTKSHEKSK